MNTKITKTLEEDIQASIERISQKTPQLDTKISALENKIKTYTKWAWAFVVVGFGIAILGSILYLCQESNKYSLNLLGDFYGGTVASFWTLAGLFFIYIAFLGQKQQLFNQQLEIMHSQLEVKYTRKEMIEQNRTAKQQRFENTFFQLLRNHQDIVNTTYIRRDIKGTWTVATQGRDCFKTFYAELKVKIQNARKLNQTLDVIKCYMELYHDRQSDLGHYFRHLYHILKFVNDSTDIEEENKFKYSSLLKALLSSYELVLLFYNGLGEYGVTYFKPLIEKFSFLKNLDTNLLIDKSHKTKYDNLAFASSEERQKVLATQQSKNSP